MGPYTYMTYMRNMVRIMTDLSPSIPSIVLSSFDKGPVVRIGPNDVDVMDLRGVKEIHSVKAAYVKTPYYNNFGPPGMNNMFTTQDVNLHRHHRRLLQGPFAETQLKAFHPIVEHRVRLAVQRLEEEAETRGAADVFKWWMFMATDVIGELTLGESFRMLELGKV